jgi:hypothetical protein
MASSSATPVGPVVVGLGAETCSTAKVITSDPTPGSLGAPAADLLDPWRRFPPSTGGQALMVIILALFLFALTSPSWASGPVRCQTYPEPTMGRQQTICDDGTRATSYWNRTLERWDTTVSPPPGQTCTGRLNPTICQWEGRCR